MGMKSSKESILIKSFFGNTMSLKIDHLEDDMYSIMINGEGYVLDDSEMKKVKKYLSDTICK